MAGEVQSLARGFALCEALADYDAGGVGLGKLATKVGLTPSTTHRLLATLVEEGYVIRSSEKNSYVLGHRIIGMASSIRRRTAPLRELAHKHLEEIAKKTGETVNLVVLDGKLSVYIDQVDGSGAVRMSIRVGSTFPAHTSASAKAILAYQQSDAQLELLFKGKKLEKVTKNTITDIESFGRQLQEVRERGFAIEREEVEYGVSCVAAPIIHNGTKAIAAISVPGPTGRILEPEPALLGELILKHTKKISANLGKRFN